MLFIYCYFVCSVSVTLHAKALKIFLIVSYLVYENFQLSITFLFELLLMNSDFSELSVAVLSTFLPSTLLTIVQGN